MTDRHEESQPDASFSIPDSGSVGRLARTGAIWSAMQIVARLAINVGMTAVLARLLTPSDFGVFGMAVTLTAFMSVFADMGLSWATVQRQDISRAQVDNLFWVNAVFGLFLWVACVIAAPFVSRFYHHPELSPICYALGFTFFLSSLTVQPVALLKRRLGMKQLSTLDVFAALCSMVVAIVMAVRGYGYWALVGQSLVYALVRLIVMFIASGYRPGWARRNAETGSLLKFGGYVAVGNIITYFSRNLDNILIGRVWGAQILGYYTRAYTLMTLPTVFASSALTDVMVPSLSALQNDRERLGSAYRRAVTLIAFLACPVAMGLAVAAPEAVRLVYGEKWLAVVPIFTWLSLAAVTQPISGTTGWLYLAVGRVRTMLIWSVSTALILAAGFFIAIPSGAIAVARMYAILVTFVFTVPSLYIALRVAGLPMARTLEPAARILGITVAMGIVTFVVGRFVQATGAHWLLVLTVKTLVGTVVYLVLSIALLRPLPLEMLERWKRALLGRKAGAA